MKAALKLCLCANKVFTLVFYYVAFSNNAAFTDVKEAMIEELWRRLYSGATRNVFHQNATKKCCILIAAKLIRGPYARDFIKNIATGYLNQR